MRSYLRFVEWYIDMYLGSAANTAHNLWTLGKLTGAC